MLQKNTTLKALDPDVLSKKKKSLTVILSSTADTVKISI